MTESEKIIIGEGFLSWNREEAGTQRLGTVNLWKDLEGTHIEDQVPFAKIPEGLRGVLSAEVIFRTRPWLHLFGKRLSFEEVPQVGEIVILGEGTIFQEHRARVENIGVKPSDDREKDWLDKEALRKVHNQLVRLQFEFSEEKE